MGRKGTAQVPWKPFLTAVSTLAMVGLMGLAATSYIALRTLRGLRMDTAVSDAVSSPVEVLDRLSAGLDWVSVLSVGLSLLACILLALLRRRLDLALGALVAIGGANLTTQILKAEVFTRSSLSPGLNSLPSGHTTVVLSIAIAAVMVAPSAWRSTVAVGVSATASLVSLALVLDRWHRPSDVIAAIFVCVLWAAVGLLAAAVVKDRPPVSAHNVSVFAGALVGAWLVGGLLVSWGVRPEPGIRDLGLSILSFGSIGLICALSVAAVARVADRHLG